MKKNYFLFLLFIGISGILSGQNLITTNSDFELGSISGWSTWGAGTKTVTSSSNDVYQGTYSMKLEGGSGGIYRTVNLLPNTDYQLTAYAKTTGGTFKFGYSGNSVTVTGSTFGKYTINFTTGATVDPNAHLYFFNNLSDSNIGFIDEIELVEYDLMKVNYASPNGNFEYGDISGWSTWGGGTKTVTSVANDVHAGTYSMVLNGGRGGIYRLVNLEANTNYELTAYAKTTGGTFKFGYSGSSVTVSGSTFEKYTVNFATGATVDPNAHLYFFNDLSDSNIGYVDDIQLVAVPPTELNLDIVKLDFEITSGLGPWQKETGTNATIQTLSRYHGKYGLDLENGGVYQIMAVPTNSNYLVTFFAKGPFCFSVEQVENGQLVNKSEIVENSNPDTWSQFSMNYNVGSADSIKIRLYHPTASFSADYINLCPRVSSQTTPSAPSNLTLKGTRSWIELKWQDNAINETGYKIYFNTTVSKPSTPAVIVPADIQKYYLQDLDGLTADTQYYIWIEAFNEAGSSTTINANTITVSQWALDSVEVSNVVHSSTVPKGMELVFHDEFNYDQVDKNKWTTEYMSGLDFEQRRDQSKTDSNRWSNPIEGDQLNPQEHKISNGVLQLQVTDNTPTWIPAWEGLDVGHQSSGWKVPTIQTSNWRTGEKMFTPSEGGYFEIRVLHPAGAGPHTAFWTDAARNANRQLQGSTLTSGYDSDGLPFNQTKDVDNAGNIITLSTQGGQRASGQAFEFDIFEQYGAEYNYAFGITYQKYIDFVGHPDIGLYTLDPAIVDGTDGNWHTYGFEWLPDKVNWYVDGQYRTSFTGYSAHNFDINVIINLYIFEDRWGSEVWNYNSNWISTYSVDYFRYYQYPEPNGNQVHNGNFEIDSVSLAPWIKSVSTNPEINVGGGVNNSNSITLDAWEGVEQLIYLDPLEDYDLKLDHLGSSFIYGLEYITPGYGISGSLNGTISANSAGSYTTDTIAFSTSDVTCGEKIVVRLWIYNNSAGAVNIDNVSIIENQNKSAHIENIRKSDELVVFPNPAVDRITINGLNLKKDNNVNFQLIGTDGKIFLSRQFKLKEGCNSLSVMLNSISLKSGFYIVRLISDEINFSQKIAISK